MPTMNKLCADVAAAVRANADALTELDRAIGDGDHGANLRRGFDAVAALGAEFDAMPPGQALQKAGMTLVMKVGGASGPLYGSLLMGIGKSLTGAANPVPAGGTPSPSEIAEALRAGIDMVRQRGKSDAGDKTMLDVLIPVCEALDEGVSQSLPIPRLLDELGAAAARGLESTRALRARKGRASFLGERSIGHLDPGAGSNRIIIDALCASLRGTS
ncbi:MAG: dihydroxyacetone kinase subunit DhaL [Thiotrichales bacterium]|nr:dihydroxyacetone kinase subunit DhaL [Thiotrichales bacterium]